jgi:hypothetical protein
MMNAFSNPSATLMKRLLIVMATLTCLASCDDGTASTDNDVAAFSQQLQGTWTLDKVTVNPNQTGSTTIAPVKEYACDKLSAVFKAKDVVNKYEITYSDRVVRVMKYYTCTLAPEELSWRIEPDALASTNTSNWMTGKNFSIKEINEATLTSKLKLLFFNLDNHSPDGKPCTSSTRNKLILEVEFDTKEAATFRLEFSKTK